MGKFTFEETFIKDLFVITPTVFGDSRGYFMETYNKRDLEEAGLTMEFVQDNQSSSVKGVLRGLHFQKEFPQGKLVRVVKGAVFDVAVDLRKDSETYGKWYGVEVDYNTEVLPLIGSKEGIMHICQTFINPGDKVLVPNPGYAAYKSAVSMTGGVMLPYSLNKENGFKPDFEAIEAAGVEGVKIMFANFPGMPTGQTPTKELFEEIVAFGRKHNILIIHDNPYSFIRNNDAPMSILSIEGAKDVAMEMNSLSKGHSMAGWRVGVIIGKEEWINSILTFKSNMDSGMFYPIQAAAETALSLGEDWFTELNAIYREREKEGNALLDALGCTYQPNQAGLFIWAEIPADYEGDCYDFSDEVMEKCDVFLTPGGIFGTEGKRYVRITLCCPAELLKKATENVKARYTK